jgi:hypothetical protein
MNSFHVDTMNQAMPLALYTTSKLEIEGIKRMKGYLKNYDDQFFFFFFISTVNVLLSFSLVPWKNRYIYEYLNS